jgi:hypothetical protein
MGRHDRNELRAVQREREDQDLGPVDGNAVHLRVRGDLAARLRGVADEVSDIEMLIVTREPLALEDCFGFAREAGLVGLDTWSSP